MCTHCLGGSQRENKAKMKQKECVSLCVFVCERGGGERDRNGRCYLVYNCEQIVWENMQINKVP